MYAYQNKSSLLEYVTAFANAERTAIEFYENGSNRFGGEIEQPYLTTLHMIVCGITLIIYLLILAT